MQLQNSLFYCFLGGKQEAETALLYGFGQKSLMMCPSQVGSCAVSWFKLAKICNWQDIISSQFWLSVLKEFL